MGKANDIPLREGAGIDVPPWLELTGARPAWRRLLSWLPVPLFLAATLLTHALRPELRYESQAVVSTLYTLFCASPGLIVVFLAGQTFLRRGSPRMLLLGLGAAFFSIIYLLAALLLPDYNAGVTVHNAGLLLSGIGFLLSGLATDQPVALPYPRRRLVLGLAYPAAAAATGAWIWAAHHGLLPTFYRAEGGYTVLRHAVLGLGVTAYFVSSLRYWHLYHRTGGRFDRWFCQGLAIIGIAMVAAILIPAGGTVMAWVARAGQGVGGVYLFMAILCAVQDSGAWRIPLERSLRRQELRYRAVVENMSEGLLLVDGGGNLLLVNEAMRRLAGWTGNLAGGSLESDARQLQVRDSRGRDVPVADWPSSRALRGETVRDEELSVHHLDTGRRYVALCSAQPIRDEFGRIDRVVVTTRDITQRKRAEEALGESENRLRLANRVTNDVIWDWDIVHDAQRWNESGTVVFGWRDIVESPQTADWWLERVHPEDRQRVEEGFLAAVGDPSRDQWRDEYRFLRADGDYAEVLDRGHVLRDERGEAIRMIGAMLDVTERNRLVEELRRSRDELELRVEARTAEVEAESARRRHLAKRLVEILEEDRLNLSMMLHDDIGQSIAGTKMEIENLKFDLDAGAGLQAPERLDRIEERLRGIMISLRDTSRQLRPSSLDTLGLAAALRSIETADPSCRIHHFIREEPPWLGADVKLALFRIAQEAVTNAMRHASCSEIHLSLVARGETIVLMAEDDGRGFSWDEAVSERSGRAPLGLLVMKERAVNAGGTLHVESTPEKGTLVQAEFTKNGVKS